MSARHRSPPGLVSSSQSDTPLETLREDHISGSSRHVSRGLEISPKGEWTFVAAQRVPETPKEIKEWLKGTISVPEQLLMSFQEISEENLIVEYSTEFSESESGSEFANLRPVTIEGSHQLFLGHSGTTMEVDFEGLLFCETPHKIPLQVMAIPEMAIVFSPEEEVFHMPPSITADFCFEHINRVNRELGTLRSDYTKVRQVLCFWQPQLDKMVTWLWELRQMHQGTAHRLEQLGECPREIVGIQGILQQLFDGMNKLNNEAKTYA